MKRLTLFCLAVLAAVSLFSLPAGDARFLKVEIAYQLHTDGSWDMTYQHRVRLDTYYAVNRAFGETFIVYDPGFQKLEILKAETTMADGRKLAAPTNAFNEVLPYAAHGFTDFSELREMVVTHTGLERGAVVDLQYRVSSRAGFFPVFSGREELAKAFPVDSYKLTISMPAGQELRYRVFGLKAEAEISASGAKKRYTFALADVKAAAHEPLAPGQAAAFVVFSGAADWGQALALAGDDSRLPAALAEKIEKLEVQYPDRPDLLAALQKVTATEVQNCGLGPDAAGWQPRPLERVVRSNYGTRLEKALLLRAMLRQAGIEAELLAVAAGPDFAPEVPSLLQMGEYWLKVMDGPEARYVDPGHEQNEFFPYRCQSFEAFNLSRQELEKLPVANWDQNGVEISGTVVLDPAGASGTLLVAARGIFNRYPEAVENGGKFIEELLKKIFPVQKAEIKKLLALTPHETRAEVAFSGPWLKDAGAGTEGPRQEGFFSVDACRLPGLSESMVQQVQRETPLVLDAPFKVSLDLDLQPAAGLRLDYAAPDAQVKNETGYFSRSLSREKNGQLRFSLKCGIGKSLIGPEKYPLLRKVLLPYFAPDFWLLFKKGN